MLDAILLATDAARRSRAGPRMDYVVRSIGVHPDTIATLRRLSAEQSEASVVLPTAHQESPYIHFERDRKAALSVSGNAAKGRDAGSRRKRHGMFSLSHDSYFSGCLVWAEATRASATRERNFLPFIPWLGRRAIACTRFRAPTTWRPSG